MVKSESIQFNNKYQIPMAAYTFDVLSRHQKNRIFLLFSRYLEYFIEPFLHQSNISTIFPYYYISFHAIAQVSHYLFLCFLKQLPNWWRRGSVRASGSWFTTIDIFEKFLNEISCVNIFPLLLPTLNLKFTNVNFPLWP